MGTIGYLRIGIPDFAPGRESWDSWVVQDDGALMWTGGMLDRPLEDGESLEARIGAVLKDDDRFFGTTDVALSEVRDPNERAIVPDLSNGKDAFVGIWRVEEIT